MVARGGQVGERSRAWAGGGSGTAGGGSGSVVLPPPTDRPAHGSGSTIRRRDLATYFYKVAGHLAEEGETLVFTPAVDPFNNSMVRGEMLIAHVERILAETGHAKVNLIGHSQGGLDARVVAHERPDLVAAVLTVATPHQGTPIADDVLGLTGPVTEGILDALVRLISPALYGQPGSQTKITEAFKLSTPGIAEFSDLHG